MAVEFPKVHGIPSCINLSTYVQGMSDYELLCEVIQVVNKLSELASLSVITYADPLQWNITTQYSANTVVVDPETGVAYLSKQPVPAGVQIFDTNYWTKIANFDGVYNQLISAITNTVYEKFGMPAREAIKTDSLVWIDNVLYKCVTPVSAGQNILSTSFIQTNLDTELENLVEQYKQIAENLVEQYKQIVENTTSDLNRRLSNIIADGTQTEGNVELIDIRTGADGKVYPTAGDAVREQVGRINGDLVDLKDLVCRAIAPTFEIIDGNYINQNGDTSPNNSFKRSDLISVDGAKFIVPNYSYDNQYVLTIAFYLESNINNGTLVGTPITKVVSGERYKVPNGAKYVVLSGETNTDLSCNVYYSSIDELNEKSEKNSNDITELQSSLIKTLTPTIESSVGYIKPDGSVNPQIGFKYSQYINCDGYIKLTSNYSYNNQYVGTLTFYTNTSVSGLISDNVYTKVEKDTSYDIPNGAKYFRLSGETNTELGVTLKKEKLECLQNEIDDVKENMESRIKNNSLIFEKEIFDSSASMSLNPSDSKYNHVISFGGFFDTFTDLTIGHGENIPWVGYSCKVTPTNFIVYSMKESANEIINVAHGLNLSEFIYVSVESLNNEKATFRIQTLNGNFNITCGWDGIHGVVGAYTTGTFANCSLTYYCSDYKKNTWIFGDSYLHYWTPLINSLGYTDYMADGYPGNVANMAFVSLNKCLEYSIPNKIVWLLGMNNSDNSDSVNTVWKQIYDNLTELCNKNNIELVLSTIPNVPNISHIYKNDIVRNSGYKYIDIAKSLNAEELNSTWFTGLLGNDNVHPSTKGAWVIARKIISTLPELYEKGVEITS